MRNTAPELIIGYLQGTLSRKEEYLFYAWVDKKEENKNLFFKTKAIYDACSPLKNANATQSSWKSLLHKRKLATSLPYRLWQMWGRYAAVAATVLVLSSIFFLKYNHHQESKPIHFRGGNNLEAGIVILPDGSSVKLGSNTNFHCDTYYGEKNRIVYLEGEAYFDVANKKDHPFIVKIKGQEIEALGTKFNVMAYPEDSVFTTTLLEGSVKLTTQELASSTTLKPDQQFVYNRRSHTTYINQVDGDQFISWTNGYYYFESQTLESILYRLKHLYGIDFIVKSENLNKRIFVGTFYKGQSPKNIMEIINLSIPIKYEISKDKVTLWER